MATRRIITGVGFPITRGEAPHVLLRMARGLLARRPPVIKVRYLENRPYRDFVFDCECGQTLTVDLQEVSDHVLSKHGRFSFKLEDGGAPAPGRVQEPGLEAEGA